MSIDAGIELIKQQKAKIVIVGSSDKNMFSDKFKDLIDKPFQEISASIAILTSAELAIEMGLPIYAICSYVHSSLKISDLDTINNNNQIIDKKNLLDWKNRKQNLDEILENIDKDDKDLINYLTKYYSHDFYKNDKTLSHITGALSTWGLTIDDINVSVFNNFNHCKKISNCNIIQKQMEYLGRNSGNLLPIILPDYSFCNNSSCFGFIINTLMHSFQTGEIPINNKINHLELNTLNSSNLFLHKIVLVLIFLRQLY